MRTQSTSRIDEGFVRLLFLSPHDAKPDMLKSSDIGGLAGLGADMADANVLVVDLAGGFSCKNENLILCSSNVQRPAPIHTYFRTFLP